MRVCHSRDSPIRKVARSRATPTLFARELFSALPSRYDRLAFLLSLGQDRRWRNAVVSAACEANPEVLLDVACGPGAVTRGILGRGATRVVGLDVSEEMLRQGLAWPSAEASLRRALVLGRAEELPFADDSFDALTFTYLLRYVTDPATTLRELVRVVRTGGVVASLEFAVPTSRWWRAWWGLYTRAVLPVLGLALGGPPWWRAGRFLGPSIDEHYRRYPMNELATMWQRAGLSGVVVRPMSLGGGVIVTGKRAR